MKCDYLPATLNKRLRLQSRTREGDGQGGFTEAWTDIATVWGSVEPARGYEKMLGMQLQSPVTHKVLVRYRRDLTTATRLIYRTRVFDVKEAINLEERGQWLRLTCVEGNAINVPFRGTPWESIGTPWESVSEIWGGENDMAAIATNWDALNTNWESIG